MKRFPAPTLGDLMNRPRLFTLARIAVLVLLVPWLCLGQEIARPVKVTIENGKEGGAPQTLPIDPLVRITPEYQNLNFSLTIEGKRITFVAHNGAWLAARIDGQMIPFVGSDNKGQITP